MPREDFSNYDKTEFYNTIRLMQEYQVGNEFFYLKDNKIVPVIIYEVTLKYYNQSILSTTANKLTLTFMIRVAVSAMTQVTVKPEQLYKTREEAAEAFLDNNAIPKKLLQVLKDPKPRTTVGHLIEKLKVVDPETDLGDRFWNIAKEVERSFINKITPEDVSFSEKLHVDRETGNAGIGTQASEVDITLDYWDCECSEKYIHSVKVDCCPFCKAKREDMPNSRKDEVCTKNMCNYLSD